LLARALRAPGVRGRCARGRRNISWDARDGRNPNGTTTSATLALLTALAVLAAPASARTPSFGAWTPSDPYHGDTSGARDLQAATGRHVDIVHWYQSWGGGAWISSVQQHAIAAVTREGRTPMLTWEPWSPGAGTAQPAYRLARIADGSFDDYITSWAVGLRAVGAVAYLRPMHEFNADWYPWGGRVNGNSAAQFVQAWRHIVDIFRAAGASNVRFVWSPLNVDVPASNKLESYYPGDAYVDVLAIDGYNWGAGTPQFGGWQTFSQVFRPAYDRLRALGRQPIWIAEVATSTDGGDKTRWIRDMFARASAMRRIKAIVWFNEDKERDWRAAPTPQIAAAFAPVAAAGPDTSRPKLMLSLGRRGRSAVLRWRATNARAVVTWKTYLNGRPISSAGRRAPQVARTRIARPGRYHWTVVGRDGEGAAVVSARRSFRVRR
jgi:hypothetical protein